MTHEAGLIEALAKLDYQECDVRVRYVQAWSEPGDLGHITFTSRAKFGSFVTFKLTRSQSREPLLSSVAAEAKNEHKTVFREGHEQFYPRVFMRDASAQGDFVVDTFLQHVARYESEMRYVIATLRQPDFYIGRGQPGNDTTFALFASMFTLLQAQNRNSIIERMSELLDITMEAAKTRVRTARDRNLLTSPGKGVVTSELTAKARKLLTGQKNTSTLTAEDIAGVTLPLVWMQGEEY